MGVYRAVVVVQTEDSAGTEDRVGMVGLVEAQDLVVA